MSLDDLTARDLAQIDAICLEYEAELRNGNATPVDALIEKVNPELVDVLREELDAIREEVERALNPKPIIAPFQSIAAPTTTPTTATPSAPQPQPPSE
ncbi:MAG: hypothetical protein HKN47_16380, partial [Pirellulaceae bacterium]|nr:hypothetical protein [Pirellulaceae bacterium]